MSTVSITAGDSLTMLRRNLTHTTRNPATIFQSVLFPVVIMFMFVYVLGGAFDVGVDYVDYAVPGLIVMALSYGLAPAAIAVNSDMTKGIINRFKAMDVSGGAVLSGHVVATTARSLIADAVIIGVGFAMGFRSEATVLQWLAAIGVMVLLGLAASWFTVAVGLAAKTSESAAMASVPLTMLPFLSSAFVPAESMGAGVRQFAEYQPFTPIIETLRGLLAGTPSTGTAIVAVVWCLGIALVGYLWSMRLFSKRA